MDDKREPPAAVTFADEAFTPEEAQVLGQWRDPTSYELAVFARLLTVDFPGRELVEAAAAGGHVRQLDRCGCIEFKPGAEVEGDDTIVAEGAGPADDMGTPVEVMLTIRNHRPLWLEFHRYGGRNDFFPPADEFVVRRFG